MKILVVDDEPSIQKSIVNFGTKAGHELETADNGKIAYDLCAKETPYEIILMDMYMPEMNGTQACEAIRGLGHGSSYTIILVSGMEDMDEEEIKKWGFNGFVKKPLGKTAFNELIEKYKK